MTTYPVNEHILMTKNSVSPLKLKLSSHPITSTPVGNPTFPTTSKKAKKTELRKKTQTSSHKLLLNGKIHYQKSQ